MKLRNLLLTAALFLTAGIASAAVVYEDVYNVDEATEETPRVKIGEDIFFEIPQGNFYINNVIDEFGTHRDLYGHILVSVSNPGSNKFTLLALEPFEHAGSFWTADLNEGENEVYLPHEAGSKYAILVNDGGVSASPLNWPGGRDLSFSPESFSHEGRQTIVFNDQNGNKTTVTFGSPLPTPVITLLIALGLGAAFVMYRNRKQVKA